MYVEDTGAGDGDIQVTVAGEQYAAEANYDLDGNGVDETVAVMTDDGYFAYTDVDADGAADVWRTVDEHGTVVGQARYDETTGEWIAEQPNRPPAGESADDPDARAMVVDTPQGDREVGPPTEDTDNDGTPDTAIVDTGSGQMMVTDVDGDGSADQTVEVSDTGRVTVSHHTGDGEWTVVERGRIGGDGRYTPDGEPSATGDAAWEPGRDPGGREQQGTWADWAGSGALGDSDSLWA